MKSSDILSYLYNGVIRETATSILRHPRFAVDRSELATVSDQLVSFGEAESYHPPLPTGSDPIPPEIETYHREINIPAPFVCALSGTQLVGPDLVAITRDGRYVLEETVAKPEMLTDALAKSLYRGVLPIRRRNARKINRPVASLAGIQSHAYFHWFADYLPRVRGIEQYAEVTGVYPDVIISPDVPEWMKKSIRYAGLPEKRLIQWDEGRASVDTLVIPSVPRDANDPSRVSYSPHALRWLGDRIRSNINVDSRNENRILVTRRGATTRRLVNEDEVINALSSFGFEPVNLSALPFEEQVKLFAGAEAVVAPHGAGLINVIFSEDIRIVELFGDFVSPLYYCIAGGLNFPYRYETCEAVRPTAESSGISVPGNDLVVDTEKLETTVQEWAVS